MGSSGPKGQTQPPQAAQGRANSELRDSPTRPQGGAAPKKTAATKMLQQLIATEVSF